MDMGKPHLDCDEIILLSVVAGLYKMDKVAKRKKKENVVHCSVS